MAYGRRSSLFFFLTGALIMLASLVTMATLVGSRPATAGSEHGAHPVACPDCATVVSVKTVILETPGNPLAALIQPAAQSPREIHVTVRRDDGTTKTISLAQGTWQAGDRVRLIGSRLQALDAG